MCGTGCEESSDVKVERHRPGDPEVAAIHDTGIAAVPGHSLPNRNAHSETKVPSNRT